MGSINKTQPVKLFCGIIYNSENIFDSLKIDLVKEWGDIDIESNTIDFNFTNYYEKEMGKNLLRRWISFKDLIDPSILPLLKIKSNDLEDKYKNSGNRNINIDPGYLTLAKIILASTKDYSHRIYLSNGIYAEVTMRFVNGKYSKLPWTYPDYQTDLAMDFFQKMRNIYSLQLHKQDTN